MIELLTHNPETKQQFFAWVEAGIAELTPVVDQFDNRTLLPQVGELIRRAKYHATRLGLSDIAERLPEYAEKSPCNGLLRLRECLQPTTDPDAFLTAEQVSAMVKLDIRTIRRQVTAGKFPAPVRFGRNVRWRRQDINRLW
jgi:predicted DNA-binding transcriptional regulator AlpA